MNSTLKSLLGGLSGALIAFTLFSVFSFTHITSPEQDSSGVAVNRSISIPKEIHILDTTILLTRYDMRERFDREMLQFVYQHSLTITTIKRANKYLPVIDSILKVNGVPSDLKYLALIESNFNVRAISPMKAAGLWQLMPQTAKELGLIVNEEIDERYHVEKSTEAACRYFKRAYSKFGNWFVVAASFNAGMGKLHAEQCKQQTCVALDLLLPEETSRYLFRLFAAKELLSDPYKYGFLLKKEDMYQTVKCSDVVVNSSVPNWTAFAKQYGISYAILKDFNVWLRNPGLVNKAGRKYIVKIPNKDELNFDINKVVIYQKNWVQE